MRSERSRHGSWLTAAQASLLTVGSVILGGVLQAAACGGDGAVGPALSYTESLVTESLATVSGDVECWRVGYRMRC